MGNHDVNRPVACETTGDLSQLRQIPALRIIPDDELRSTRPPGENQAIYREDSHLQRCAATSCQFLQRDQVRSTDLESLSRARGLVSTVPLPREIFRKLQRWHVSQPLVPVRVGIGA